MQRTGREVLVVGVDESAHSDAALRYVLDEAVLRGASLREVIACPPPSPRPAVDEVLRVPEAAAVRRASAELVRRRAEEVRRPVRGTADVEIEVVARTGSPLTIVPTVPLRSVTTVYETSPPLLPTGPIARSAP